MRGLPSKPLRKSPSLADARSRRTLSRHHVEKLVPFCPYHERRSRLRRSSVQRRASEQPIRPGLQICKLDLRFAVRAGANFCQVILELDRPGRSNSTSCRTESCMLQVVSRERHPSRHTF